MRLISAALLMLLLSAALVGPSYAACPNGYVDCGRGVCCPQ